MNNMRITDKYVFFWANDSCFSQWHHSVFFVDNVEYNCAEQYMMAEKAYLFNDLDSRQKIMRESNPRKQKSLGRNVKNFDHAIWRENAKSIVYKGNLAKFSQNELFQLFLLNTGGREIVEASPYDTIWGIGLSYDNDLCLDENNWRGTNWLGEVLVNVRNDIRNLVKPHEETNS